MERFPPGTVVSVGTHSVEVVNYLAEGGFAQIYIVKFLEYLNEFESKSKVALEIGDVACLKRVLVPDENGLGEMRNEVEVMKQLRGARNIVQYYDSNACRRNDGSAGFEVLLLMELCPNKSLLDYMNLRLATKLTEKEIMKIMYDVSLAVAQMHYLPTPLIHRDIKIENVLVDDQNNFKLCDFGSTSTCFPVVTTHQEIAILTQNIYVHTTPQYRSPEMIDLYRCLPINEKSDIWALGIFLYKLLFFITPFEMTGQFSILHSKYEFPPNNAPSKLINLVIVMLAENPYMRPNIYQVLSHICCLLGVEAPIEDKYGIGAYNFEGYTEFQTKLQNVQYQMYILQQKKLENGILSPLEEKLLNELLITSFEVSSKVPVEIGTGTTLRTPEIDNTTPPDMAITSPEEIADTKKGALSGESPSRHPSNATSSHREKSSSDTIEDQYENEYRKNDSIKIQTVEQQHSSNNDGLELNAEMDPKDVPAIPVVATVAREHDSHLNAPQMDQRQKSFSSFSSGGKSLGSISHGMSSDEAFVTESTVKSELTPGAKLHKSNNPFPMMAQGFSPNAGKESGPKNNFFLEDQTAELGQQQPQLPKNDGQYRAQNELSQFQQPSHQQLRQQPILQVPQAQQSTPQGYNQHAFYRPIDGPVPVQQPQPVPFNQAPGMSGLVGSNVRYNFQGIPQNPNSPYYPVQQTQPPKQPSHSEAMAPPPPPLPQTSVNIPQEDIPPPIPSHPKLRSGKNRVEPSESLPNLSEQISKGEELLLEFSPQKEQNYGQNNDRSTKSGSPVIQNNSGKIGSLDLSYNEMDLSQEEIKRSSAMRDALYTGGMDSSIASSESIELDLEDARMGGRSVRRIAANEPIAKGPSPPIHRRHLLGGDTQFEEVNNSSSSVRPSRRSLDLKYHEVHFSSPDLGHEDSTINLENKSSVASKHNAAISEKTRIINNAESGRRGIASNTSSRSSRKQSSNSGTSGTSSKVKAQVRHDLEKYQSSSKKGSNSGINISTQNSTGMRKSFAKARQSLDLERVRREALKNSEGGLGSGKRRSLFSVFRGSAEKK